ncbi:uncharacterized protein GGS22DRAFT_192342 [Annulohypoxylon maeteangense]|uniref:uncharacterized protein n=1 Tax=Annulohypoxylon maeteangense TaxID=1927788 RepID=UPI002007615B|nr:uncharacterized protein GGS22DRAFT_192342 [Annulohypoxylon maeteangense]KAI0881255.1 hypothetical protein GGS22DRAFT_192342 [Annulohypoxylon maeteangense]
MVKIPPKKRIASHSQEPYPAPVRNRGKREEGEGRIINLASIPKYGEARTHTNTAAPLGRRRPTPMEYLEQIYSGVIFDAVMKPTRQPRVIPGIPAVFVVGFTKNTWRAKTPETGIVGTYSTAEAANIQVMTFFNGEFPALTRRMREASGEKYVMKTPRLDGDGLAYWVDMDNCLQLFGRDGSGRYAVYACRQEVKGDGFDGPYLKSGDPRERLTAEEEGLQAHLANRFHRAV